MPNTDELPRYHRDAATWSMFAALFAFGVLNAVLGPALPYLREAEDLSYVAANLVGRLLASRLAQRMPESVVLRLAFLAALTITTSRESSVS